MSLRNRVIKLAHQKPELREHLLPLVKNAATKTIFHEILARFLPREASFEMSTNSSGYSVLYSEIRTYKSSFKRVEIILKKDRNTVLVLADQGFEWSFTTNDPYKQITFKLSENTTSSCMDLVENFVKRGG